MLSAYPDLEVVGAVSDGTEVLDCLSTTKPDVILMDIRMPKMDGVLATKVIKEKFPNIKVIILTTFDDDDFIYSALKYGASGYLLKGTSMNELHDAVVTVNEGRAMLNPDIATKVFKLFSQLAQSNFAIKVDDSLTADISKMEWRVIQQIAFGLSNKEIAAKLYLSEGTVRNYLSNILSKLNLHDRTQLAIWAVQTGITLRTFEEDNHD